jgi:hypothetical protein
MKVSRTRILGMIGIAGAPWMLIDFMENGLYDHFKDTPASGVRGFLFITGWTCSVWGLYRLQAAGTKSWGKTILLIQVVLLLLANCWNLYVIIRPQGYDRIFIKLSYFWMASAFFMLITGVVVIAAKRWQGFKRYLPLLAGLWIPIVFFVVSRIFGLTLTTLIISGVYATLVFTLLGFSVITSTYEPLLKQRAKSRNRNWQH